MRRREFQRLTAAGVNPKAAEILACHLYAAHLRDAEQATRRYALERARRSHRRRKAKPVPCPECPTTVRADNLSKHLRRHLIGSAA